MPSSLIQVRAERALGTTHLWMVDSVDSSSIPSWRTTGGLGSRGSRGTPDGRRIPSGTVSPAFGGNQDCIPTLSTGLRRYSRLDIGSRKPPLLGASLPSVPLFQCQCQDSTSLNDQQSHAFFDQRPSIVPPPPPPPLLLHLLILILLPPPSVTKKNIEHRPPD
jgi:hypothetical protein